MAYTSGRWANLLRSVATADSRSLYGIAVEAKIDQGQFSRFMKGKASLSLETAERLAWVLGVNLVAGGQAGDRIGVEIVEPKIRTARSVAPVDLTPSDDEPEPRIPIKATKMDNRPELTPMRVEDKPRVVNAVPSPGIKRSPRQEDLLEKYRKQKP